MRCPGSVDLDRIVGHPRGTRACPSRAARSTRAPRPRTAAHRALLDHELDGAPTTLAWLLPVGTTPEPGALVALVDTWRRSPSAGVVGPKHLDADRPAPAARPGHPHHPRRPPALAPAPGEPDQGQYDRIHRRPRRAVRRLPRRARPARRPARLGDLLRRRRCRPRPRLARPQRRPPGRCRALGAVRSEPGVAAATHPAARGVVRLAGSPWRARRGGHRPSSPAGSPSPRSSRPSACSCSSGHELGWRRAVITRLPRPVPRHRRPLAHASPAAR